MNLLVIHLGQKQYGFRAETDLGATNIKNLNWGIDLWNQEPVSRRESCLLLAINQSINHSIIHHIQTLFI